MERISAKEAAQRTNIPVEYIIRRCENNQAQSAIKNNHVWYLSVDDAKKAAKVYKEDLVKNGDSMLTGFKVFMTFLLVFIGVLIAGIIVIAYDDPTVGIFVAGAGALFTFLSGLLLKSNINSIKNNIKTQKVLSVKSPLKKKLVASIVAFSLAVIIIPLAALSIYGNYDAHYINDHAVRLSEEPIDEEIFEKIADFDEHYEEKSFVTKIFFAKGDTVAKVKEDAEKFLVERAEEISVSISALEPITKITSLEEYNSICNNLESLKLSEYNEFEKRVRERVENYDDFEKYSADLEELVNSKYKVTKTCGNCRGGGRFSCPTCNGSGKRVVTWYEHGDWGEKSYSSYTCTKCNGSGRSSCGSCSGQGYKVYFNFDN